MTASFRALALAPALLASPALARAQEPVRAASDTSTYATPALGAFVAAAARDNRVPAELSSYHAVVESEVAIALRREDGTEAIVAVEQFASTLRWTRAGHYEQRVVGYRARQAVPTSSAFSALPTGWIVPTLYGERLLPPRPPADSVRGQRPARPGSAMYAVHPFAEGRARYYRFAGGDTVATIRVGGDDARAIPIVRVHVEPRETVPASPANVSLFWGEIDVDAARHVVVRMRGRYVAVSSAERGLGGRVARAALRGYAFVDYETAERDGRFWLPASQRIEFQAVAPMLGESRAVLRVVSRLRDVVLNDTTLPPAVLADGSPDTTARAPRWWRITRAPRDTLHRFDDWRESLGAATSTLHSDDFDDVAPDAWRRTGPPRAELQASSGSDIVRFDRVQGLFTGAAGRVRFRDAAPGLTLRAAAGWAWSERTARGRVELEQELRTRRGDSTRAPWTLGVRAGRSLDLTNDFRRALDSGATFSALFSSVDPYDYVDRRFATVVARHTIGRRAAAARFEVGAASDRPAATHVTRGLVAGPTPFRANRGVDAGVYLRSAVTLLVRPDVAAEFVRPGVGGRLYYERGDGELRYQRLEGRVTGRVELGVPWAGALRGSTLALNARGDVGAVLGAEPPPQQLFELGGAESLQGYGYKTFAGDRAALARASLVYGSPWLRTPIRLGRLTVPGVAPGLSVGVESGVTAISGDAARRSLARLGPRDHAGSPSRASDGARTTFMAGARVFGGGLFVGVARPLDRHTDRRDGWRTLVAVGADL